MSVDLRTLLRRLERLARTMGTPVRYDAVVPSVTGYVVRGGLCRVHGRAMIVCDVTLPLVDKVAVVAEVLSAAGVEVLALPRILGVRIRRRGPQEKGAQARGTGRGEAPESWKPPSGHA